MSNRPGWQTDELAEEWIDQDEISSLRWQDSVSSHALSSSDISLTEALPSTFVRGDSASPAQPPVGTFVVREDVPAAPFLPKTPGRKVKGQVKDFFSPMPLEMMFEPPSPPRADDPPLPSSSRHTTAPAVPSRLSKVYFPSESSVGNEDEDEILETDIPNMAAFDGRKPSLNCQFTFSVPDPSPGVPMAQSTPSGPSHPLAVPPLTDPRLRLFQFQYDTFTRDHLSAMVDSIAVNTPSGTPSLSGNILSRGTEVDGENMTRLRSTKRIKLSPAADFEEVDRLPACDSRRPFSQKDYVGESRNLMEQIRQARDFSTISTVTSAQSRAGDNSVEETVTLHPNVPPPIPNSSTPSSGTANSKHSSSSSLGYRQKAADLMAQIKQDMKGSKRVFSGQTEVSRITRVESDPPLANKENEPHLTRSKRRVNHSTDEELAMEISNMSIEVWQAQVQVNMQPPHLAVIPPTPILANQNFLAPTNGPSYPSSSIRSGPNEDLNRFVSSSTATGTTLTAGSAASFVKHAGPKQMTRIGPEDVAAALSDRVGKMVLDRETMRWVKDTPAVTANGHDADDAEKDVDADSEDPFRDIESLRDEDQLSGKGDQSRIEEIEDEAETEDAEEAALNSFSFDDSSAAVVPVMTGVENDDDHSDYMNAVIDETTDSDDSRDDEFDTVQNHQQETEDISLEQFSLPPAQDVATLRTPLPTRGAAGSTPFPTARSAVKSNSVTPVSALKKPNQDRTPAPTGHRRSVSFSDGKRDGPIRGLRHDAGREEKQGTESEEHTEVKPGTGSLFVPSVRSKRIADMLEGFEGPTVGDPSPTKSSTSGLRSSEELEPLTCRRPTTLANARPRKGDSAQGRTFSRSYSHRAPSSAAIPNATFLTECSFAVSHDRLVQIITDVQPFEPYWETLSSIDISKRNVDSVARLKEFLPQLDSICLNDNQLSWLSGLPTTVRTLSVASNLITGVTSFSHLANLEHLDISRNDIDSLRQLDCLKHLRELRADGNKISSIDGLQKLDGLVKLSLQSNQIRELDFAGFRWTRLEMLNLSLNQLDTIRGLRSLHALIALNLDNNSLTDLGIDTGDNIGTEGGCMNKLRVLRVSGNKLQRLDGAHYPSLRTLYADNNALSTISHSGRLRRLENLSLRNQAKGKLSISVRDVRDLKRLYLSGNPLSSKFITEPCYNLVYFELAACRLTTLPSDFAQLIPNVRVLNLNYNFLEDIKPLEGLSRIKKLTMIGSRVKGTKGLIRMAQGMPEVEMVDFRMNPCTLGWYLPLLVKDVPGALQPSEEDLGTGTGKTVSKDEGGTAEKRKCSSWHWQELDSKFRRDLPDEAYVGRLAYRGLIMRACRGVKTIDGVEVSEKEKDKAERLLNGILGKGRGDVR